MYSTSSKLNEIILLNRKLRNALSFRGGSTRKMQDFKNKLIENKLSIIYLYITCFTTILLLCYFSLPQNKKFIGGANTMYESFSDVLQNVRSKFMEMLNNLLGELYKIIDELHNKLLYFTKKTGGPVVISINMALGGITKAQNTVLWSTPTIPWSAPLVVILLLLSTINYLYAFICIPLTILVIVAQVFTPVFIPFCPIAIVYIILIYITCCFVIDTKLYLPCYGCDTGTTLYKCMPGTGKGSIGCTIYTEFLRKIKFILKSISALQNLVSNFKKKIFSVLNKIISFIFIFNNLFYKVFGSSIEKIFNALQFLKRIEIPDDWGFNFGEFIICPDLSTKGLNCIYNKDGSLRDKHGNNPIFHTFWKMIRVILELPPPIPKFTLGGGNPECKDDSNGVSLNTRSKSNLKNLKLKKIDNPSVTEPTIKKHDVDVTVKATADKKSFDKNIAYKKLLETLIKIDINPITWIAALFNLLIDAINFIIDQNIDLLKMIITFIFSLITEAVKAMTGIFSKIINLILKPLNEVADIALKLPKQLFKTINKIFEIGPFTIITFYFYKMLTSLFPFLDKLRSFMIIIAIVIIIHGILIICPMIGGLYAFYIPFMYVYGVYSTIRGYIEDQSKILDDLNNILIENNTAIKEIKDYFMDLDDVYKIILGVFIFILIVFIILNLFNDFNRRFTTFVLKTSTQFVYGHYYNKFSVVHKKFIEFKKQKELEKEKENKKYNIINTSTQSKNYFDRLNNLQNINLTDFYNLN